MSKQAQEQLSATAESLMTQQGARDWAETWYVNNGRWPTRRYRVERGKLVSKFLTLHSAHVTQAQYGGSVIEIIPPWKDVKHEFVGPKAKK